MILHIDMDSFYASIEIRDNPSLKNLPVIIGGNSKRSVVSTANYIARNYGINAGMPIFMAKQKLPNNAVYLPVNMNKYVSVSKKIMKSLHNFSAFVEPISIDEAFLDVTGRLDESAFEIARKLKNYISIEFNLPCSIGIGKNKNIAKIASKMAKSYRKNNYKKFHFENNILEITPNKTTDFLATLKIGDINGLGSKTEKILNEIGIKTVPELANFNINILKNKLGNKSAEYLKSLANGGDMNIYSHQDKSIGTEHTFEKLISTNTQIKKYLLKIADDVGFSLRKNNKLFKTVSIVVKTSDFKSFTRSKTLNSYSNITKVIFENAFLLSDEFANSKPIRLLGIRVSNLINNKDGFQPTINDIDEYKWDIATDKVKLYISESNHSNL
jgi:DNA polymerase-4